MLISLTFPGTGSVEGSSPADRSRSDRIVITRWRASNFPSCRYPIFLPRPALRQTQRLAPVLADPSVVGERVECNHVTEVQACLGVEAARAALVRELKRSMDGRALLSETPIRINSMPYHVFVSTGSNGHLFTRRDQQSSSASSARARTKNQSLAASSVKTRNQQSPHWKGTTRSPETSDKNKQNGRGKSAGSSRKRPPRQQPQSKDRKSRKTGGSRRTKRSETTINLQNEPDDDTTLINNSLANELLFQRIYQRMRDDENHDNEQHSRQNQNENEQHSRQNQNENEQHSRQNQNENEQHSHQNQNENELEYGDDNDDELEYGDYNDDELEYGDDNDDEQEYGHDDKNDELEYGDESNRDMNESIIHAKDEQEVRANMCEGAIHIVSPRIQQTFSVETPDECLEESDEIKRLRADVDEIDESISKQEKEMNEHDKRINEDMRKFGALKHMKEAIEKASRRLKEVNDMRKAVEHLCSNALQSIITVRNHGEAVANARLLARVLPKGALRNRTDVAEGEEEGYHHSRRPSHSLRGTDTSDTGAIREDYQKPSELQEIAYIRSMFQFPQQRTIVSKYLGAFTGEAKNGMEANTTDLLANSKRLRSELSSNDRPLQGETPQSKR